MNANPGRIGTLALLGSMQSPSPSWSSVRRHPTKFIGVLFMNANPSRVETPSLLSALTSAYVPVVVICPQFFFNQFVRVLFLNASPSHIETLPLLGAHASFLSKPCCSSVLILAENSPACYHYETTVGGALPVISTLQVRNFLRNISSGEVVVPHPIYYCRPFFSSLPVPGERTDSNNHFSSGRMFSGSFREISSH